MTRSDALIIEPQPGPQTIAFRHEAQEIFYGGALGAGKSYLIWLRWIKHHQTYGRHVSGIIFRKTFPELEQLIKIGKDLLLPLGWRYVGGQQRKFIHPDGAEMRMRFVESDDDADKYWGHDYTSMNFDEYGHVSKKTFNAVQKLRAGRLRSAVGIKCYFLATGNPGGKGHKECKARYIDPSKPYVPYQSPIGKHWICFVPGRLEDNIKLIENDPEYKERAKELGPAWLVKAMLEGDWSVSPEGNIFKREDFKNRFSLDVQPRYKFTCQSWDTAFKKTDKSDRSALTEWGMTDSGFYIYNAFAAKMTFPELKRKAKDSYNARPVSQVLIEDKASGQSLDQELKENTTMPVKAIPVDDDKYRRACAVAPQFEAGNIWVAYAPWADEFIDELCAFPGISEDDYVDSASQAVQHLVRVRKRLDRFQSRQGKVVPLTGSVLGV